MPSCDYANARLAGMRSRLLGTPRILDLLAQPHLAARIEVLKHSDYGVTLAQELTRGDPMRDTERALSRRFAGDVRATLHFLAGDRHEPVLRSVLGILDAWALKAVLRGVAVRAPVDDLVSLVAPTPSFDLAALVELCRQRDVKAVVDLLATWMSPLWPPLARAWPDYSRRHDLGALELALDRAVFARALAATKGAGRHRRLLRSVIATQIDLVNAATLLKLAGHGEEPALFIVGGAALTAVRWHALARLAEPRLRAALFALAPLRRLAPAGDPSKLSALDLEQLLARALRESVTRLARVEPLSLLVPLAFVLNRQAEIQHIRLALRGAALGVPAADLLPRLEA